MPYVIAAVERPEVTLLGRGGGDDDSDPAGRGAQRGPGPGRGPGCSRDRGDRHHRTSRPGPRAPPGGVESSYLGFIFARAESPERVEVALREAHRRLEFVIMSPRESKGAV